MKKRLLGLSIITALSIGFTGCGGGGGGSSSDNGTVETSTAILSDAHIQGVHYTCGDTTGVTDENGTFSYTNQCSNVIFNIGDIQLGMIPTNLITDGIVYPSDLLGLDRNNTHNNTLVNMLQVLQSLDNDANPYNGIQIDANTSAALTGISPVYLDSNTTTAEQIRTLVVDKAHKTLINSNYAIAHYEDTLRTDLNLSVSTVPPAPVMFATLPEPTNEDNVSVVVNGPVGAKVIVNGIPTDIIIGVNHEAIVNLDTTGMDGNKTSSITIMDDNNRTSDVFNAIVVKDTIAPSLNLPTVVVDENQLAVLDINATDLHGVRYIISGIDAVNFDLNASTGLLRFKDAPDYETKMSYDVNVTAIDTVGNSSTQPLHIAINNLNDNAPIITDANVTVDENQQSALRLTAIDADNLGESFTYTLSGVDVSFFDINTTSGVVTFKNAPDYETKTSYDINATVSDGELNSTKELKITINNLNDVAPVILTSNISADENQNGELTLISSDGDHLPATYTYTLSGRDASYFDINTTTGKITFKNAPDYETKTSYDINVTVSDGDLNSTKEIAVDINNLDDVIPSFVTEETISIDENTQNFSVDATDDFPLTYSLGTGFDSDLFTIDASTGVLTFKHAPDYENPQDSGHNNTYSVIVKVADSVPAHTQEKLFVVSINNLDDVPAPQMLNGSNIVSGIVSNGLAVPNATIYLESKDKTLRSTTSDANGNFSFDISGLTGPFMLFASMNDGTRLYSYNKGMYAHVNITPVTSLILANVAQSFNTTLDDLFIDFSALESSNFETYFNNAYTIINNQLTSSLSEALLTNFNHFYNVFSYTGYNYDRVLTSYDIALSYSNVALRINNQLFTTIADVNTTAVSDINTTGVVLDAGGNAISGATVNVYYTINGTRYDFNATTDSNGQYIISVPNYRVYNINIISALLNTTYFNVNTFYSNLATLQLSPVNLVDADTSVTVGGYIFNGRTNDHIANATIKIRSGYNNRDGNVVATVSTDDNGNFSLPNVTAGSYTVEIEKNGFYPSFVNRAFLSDTTNLNLSLIADSRTTVLDRDAFATIVLTWGANPSDLDSHLYIAADASNSTRDHVYYSNKASGSTPRDHNNPCATAGVVASLDLDDTSSYGPETTSICTRYNAPAHFYVHNYSGSSYQDVSSYAKVIVQKFDGSTYEIVPPQNNPDNYNDWKVFDIDSSGNIVPVNQYQNGMSDQ